MLKKIHVTQSDFYEKAKDGKLLTYTDKRTGEQKKYKKVRLQATLEGEKKTLWGSVFNPAQEQEVKTWTPEREVELEIEVNGEYTNWKFPKKESFGAQQIEKLWEAIHELRKEVRSLKENKVEQPAEIDLADIPF